MKKLLLLKNNGVFNKIVECLSFKLALQWLRSNNRISEEVFQNFYNKACVYCFVVNQEIFESNDDFNLNDCDVIFLDPFVVNQKFC